jgi:hypothetical protein
MTVLEERREIVRREDELRRPSSHGCPAPKT